MLTLHDGHESEQERRNYENRMARETRHLNDPEFNRRVTAWLNERCRSIDEPGDGREAA